MTLSTIVLLGVAGYKPVTCEYREIKVVPKTRLTRVSDKKSGLFPEPGDWRLYLNGKPTSFFEEETNVSVTVLTIQHPQTRDVYLESTVTTSGAILVWTTTLLLWDRTTLSRVDCPSLDVLEYNPDGRLLGIVQSDSFTAVGKAEMGWERDRRAYAVLHGKAINLGGAVNVWFGKDGAIHGISNGTGGKAAPHYFTVANGIRKDGSIDESHPLKRTIKRLFGIPGVGENY